MLSKYSTISYCKLSESTSTLLSIFPSKVFNVFSLPHFNLLIFVSDGWLLPSMKSLLCIKAAQQQWGVGAFTILFTVCFFIILKRFLTLFPLLLLSLPVWLFLKLFFFYLFYSLSQKAVKLVTSNLSTGWQCSDFKFALTERYQTCSLLKQFCDPTILHLMLYLQAGLVLCLFTFPISRVIILAFPPY